MVNRGFTSHRSLHSISVPPGTHNFEPLEEEAVEQGGDDGAELLLQRIAQRLTGGGSASLPELGMVEGLISC